MSMEKPPYPVDKMGLPVMPDNTACYEQCLKGARDRNRHHLAWERGDYHTSLENKYREMACMTIRICVCRHEDLHSSYSPPDKPTRGVMDSVVHDGLTPITASEAGVTLYIRSKAQMTQEVADYAERLRDIA
jgi:hypothetical protein